MKIYTMGFKGKSQEEFIKTINKKKIELVVDMRERNRFPMLGFCNEGELKKCLKEKCNCDYLYNSMLAPMCGYYEAYTERAISWDEYVAKYKETLSERGIAGRFLIDCMEYEMDNDNLIWEKRRVGVQENCWQSGYKREYVELR